MVLFYWQFSTCAICGRMLCLFHTSLGVLKPRPTFLTNLCSFFFFFPLRPALPFKNTPRCFWNAFSVCEMHGSTNNKTQLQHYILSCTNTQHTAHRVHPPQIYIHLLGELVYGYTAYCSKYQKGQHTLPSHAHLLRHLAVADKHVARAGRHARIARICTLTLGLHFLTLLLRSLKWQTSCCLPLFVVFSPLC